MEGERRARRLNLFLIYPLEFESPTEHEFTFMTIIFLRNIMSVNSEAAMMTSSISKFMSISAESACKSECACIYK